jgi:hypothetical protein
MGNQFRISRKERTDFYIDLHNEFPCAAEFAELFHILDIANENDNIIIKIGDNAGGNLETCVKLINCVQLSKAVISVVVDSVCYSAASIFVSAMLNLNIDVSFMPHVFLMFHDYSKEEEGKGNEVILAVNNSQEWVRDIYMDYCHPFLTKAEVNRILDGKDIYVNYTDINKRLAKIRNAK